MGWTKAEDAIITHSVQELGHRWYQIAERLPGRTDHAIRNRWHRLLTMRQEEQQRQEGGGRAASGSQPTPVASADAVADAAQDPLPADASGEGGAGAPAATAEGEGSGEGGGGDGDSCGGGGGGDSGVEGDADFAAIAAAVGESGGATGPDVAMEVDGVSPQACPAERGMPGAAARVSLGLQ